MTTLCPYLKSCAARRGAVMRLILICGARAHLHVNLKVNQEASRCQRIAANLNTPEKYTLTNFSKLSIIYQIEGDYYYGFWTASIR